MDIRIVLYVFSFTLLSVVQAQDSNNVDCLDFNDCSSCLENVKCIYKISDSIAQCTDGDDVDSSEPSTSFSFIIKDGQFCKYSQGFQDISMFSSTTSIKTEVTSSTIKTVKSNETNEVVDATRLNETDSSNNEEKEKNIETFNPQDSLQCEEVTIFDFWTFCGGFFLGVGLVLVVQLCVGFYRTRKRTTYTEPFSFDSFVNP